MSTHPITDTVCKLTSAVFLCHATLVRAATEDADTRDLSELYENFLANKKSGMEPIGGGSFGSIYSCEALVKDGHGLVVKNVKPKPKDVRATMREILILKNINHPCIVDTTPVYDGANEDTLKEGCLMLMPLAEKDLHKHIQQDFGDFFGPKQIGNTKIQKWIFSILRALKYLHSAKIAHRDLKPKNILLCADGKIRLCDLGLATLLDDSLRSPNSGSNGYFAPEAVSNEKEVAYTVKIDMWSLGCIMAEIFAREMGVKLKRFDSKWSHIFQCKVAESKEMSESAKQTFKRAERIRQRDLAKKLLYENEGSLLDDDERERNLEILIARVAGVKVDDEHLSNTEQFAKTLKRKTWKYTIPKNALDLMLKLLKYNGEDRISADEALRHDFFSGMSGDDDVIDNCDVTTIQSLQAMPKFIDQHMAEVEKDWRQEITSILGDNPSKEELLSKLKTISEEHGIQLTDISGYKETMNIQEMKEVLTELVRTHLIPGVLLSALECDLSAIAQIEGLRRLRR